MSRSHRNRRPDLYSQLVQLVPKQLALSRPHERVLVSPSKERRWEVRGDVIDGAEMFALRVNGGGRWEGRSDEREEVVERHGEGEVRPAGGRSWWGGGKTVRRRDMVNSRVQEWDATEQGEEQGTERDDRTYCKMGTLDATLPSKTCSANPISRDLVLRSVSQSSGLPYEPSSSLVIP